ncbi:hypothetical protein CSOJ01_02908 [Colletotrichum sojae]|uniref:Nucleoside phosphorylase domain-containing protein n=1 Tax=Colletotrichum sojae TaxID=2175907 RepID=A0A8H6N1X9_9PEZI|nr:hypothetical protein CSOJ01_02908 [Colletotrichum sojae]
MLDEAPDALPTDAEDTNTYILGRVGSHNVVIAGLPTDQYGTNKAADVASNLKRSFPFIRACLMVGISGGVPSMGDIRLGDVVIGTRVMQHDLGKSVGYGQLQRTATVRILHQSLGTAATYEHQSTPSDCSECDRLKLVPRRIRDYPLIHYGAIASGNQVMRSACQRDTLARELDIICFEMEAAGIMDIMPCLPIRGICDYADSHKNKAWQRYAAATAAAYARQLLAVMSVSKVQSKSETANNQTDEEEARKIEKAEKLNRFLSYLNFHRLDSRQSAIESAHTHTCQWFLEHRLYKSWLEPEKIAHHHGFLWMRGKPGTGKSTIMKFAYLNMHESISAVVVSFFFNARGEHLEKPIQGMFRSLIYQLLKSYPALGTVLTDSHLQQNQSGSSELNTLKRTFEKAVLALGSCLFTCFIDALDECDEQQIMDMIQYFEDLTDETTSRRIGFRVCFSSRHYPYITLRRGVAFVMEDEPGHTQDLKAYVANRLRIEKSKHGDELQVMVLQKASGVFLWVVLVVGILNQEYSRGSMSLRKTLEEIPSGLSDLFEGILRRDSRNKEQLLLSILLVLCAKRPMKPQEFSHALWAGLISMGLADPELPDASKPKRHVFGCSKGLAEISKSTQPLVQFIHESVRDFLIKEGGLLGLWPDLGFHWEISGNERLKHCCQTYMDHESVRARIRQLSREPNIESPADIPRVYPFLEYACQHIFHHAEVAAEGIHQRDLLSSFRLSEWIAARNTFQHASCRYVKDVNLLYILAEIGCANLIRTIPGVEKITDVLGDRHQYPIFAAWACGNLRSLDAMLGSTPSTSCEMNITEQLDTFLSGKGNLANCACRNPLSWAAQEGRTDSVRRLIQDGAIITDRDMAGRTPLSRAVENGHEETVRLLIQNGADVNAFEDGLTMLTRALQRGSTSSAENLVLLPIENGINLKPYEGSQTSLTWALKYGYRQLAEGLIINGADLNFYDNSAAENPLVLASREGYEDIVRLLVSRGADVRGDGTPSRALLEAYRNGWESITRFLLRKGAVPGEEYHADALSRGYRGVASALKSYS